MSPSCPASPRAARAVRLVLALSAGIALTALATACLGIRSEPVGEPPTVGTAVLPAPEATLGLGEAVPVAPLDGERPITSTGAISPGAAAGDLPSIASNPDWDTIYVNRRTMTDVPCHLMRGGFMGDCTAEQLTAMVGTSGLLPVDAESAKGSACRLAERKIVGDCTEEEIARISSATIIVVDPGTERSAPCEASGNIIAGDCSQQEIDRLREEIRARRAGG